jgi:hypothetical protein
MESEEQKHHGSMVYNGDADINLNPNEDDEDDGDPLEDPPVYVWIMGTLAFAGICLIMRGLLCK